MDSKRFSNRRQDHRLVAPPPPRRERKEAPGTAAPAVGEEGELEVERAAEPEVEGMEE